MATQQLEKAMEGLVVLIADSNPYTRRLTRMMLTNLGIKSMGAKIYKKYRVYEKPLGAG